MEIKASDLNDYESELALYQKKSREAFIACMKAHMQLNDDTDKEHLKEVYKQAVDAVQIWGNTTAGAACKFFGKTARAKARICDVPDFILERINDRIIDYSKTHDIRSDEFLELVGSCVGSEVRHNADRTTYKNAKRLATKGVKYCRVAQSVSCCFCLMLAGRGPVYWTKETAGEGMRYHPGCKCKIVACREGDTIKGYHPEKINAAMEKIADSLGIDNWLDFVDDKDIQKLLERELKRRDPRWVLEGIKPKVDYSKNPRKKYGVRKVENDDYSKQNFKKTGEEWRDLFVHDSLALNGFALQPQGLDSLDLKLGPRMEWWEIKSPIQTKASNLDSVHWVENNIKQAKRQFKKRGMVDQAKVVVSSYYHPAEDAWIEQELLKRGLQHNIKGLIFINKRGEVKVLI